MVPRRSRISRFVAAIIAIALSAQLAGAQFAGCVSMNGSSSSGEHSAMSADHQSHTSEAVAVTASRDTQRSSTPVPPCGQTLLCANAPAIPVAELQAFSPNAVSSPVASVALTFEALTLRPDSPPPKT